MKTNKTSRQLINALLLATVLITGPVVGFAQDDDLLANTDDVLNSEQIDIDGSFQRKQSGSDRIAKLRKRLEEQNEEMMAKKIEGERIKAEQKLEVKLRKAFTGNGSDRISTRQAAPQRVVAPAPVVTGITPKRTAIIPTLGVSQILRDTENAESKVDFGVALEHAVTDNISVGFGFGYSKLQFEDPYSSYPNNGGYYNTQTAKKTDSDYEYSRVSMNFNTKFHFTTLENRFRPYVGGGLGYNRVTISDTNPNDDYYNPYNNNTNYSNPNQDTQLSDSMISATAMIGTNFLFNDMVGMNFNLSYTTFLNSAFASSDDANLSAYNNNEEKIRQVGSSISDGDVVGVNLGLLIQF